MSARSRGVLLTGPFSEADLALLAQSLRQIERRNPQALYTLLVLDGEAGLDEARATIERIFPPRSGPH